MINKIKAWFNGFSWKNPVDLVIGFIAFCAIVMFLTLVISVL